MKYEHKEIDHKKVKDNDDFNKLLQLFKMLQQKQKSMKSNRYFFTFEAKVLLTHAVLKRM